MMMYQKMISTIMPLRYKIFHHPFNQDLYFGTLRREIFNNFLIADKCYLFELSYVLNDIAFKMTDQAKREMFFSLSVNARETEKNLHHKYIHHGSVFMNKEPINNMYSQYISHLRQSVNTFPIAVSIATCLPCFSIYSHLGCYMKNNGVAVDHPYRLWIDSYSSKKFSAATKFMIDTVNDLGKSESELCQYGMLTAFFKSTQFEIAMWDDAYYQYHKASPLRSNS